MESTLYTLADPILRVENLAWSVNTIQIIKNISFSLARGEFISLIGPSGAGKSSILRLLVRFVEFQSGKVLFNNQDICQMDIISLRRNIGYISQEVFLFDGTVRDNLAFGPKLQNLPADEQKMIDLLDHVHLNPEMLDRMTNHLSGGERQRIAIVRMLMNSPKFYSWMKLHQLWI